MARFCTEKYVKPNGANLDQVFAHLTNYSLNKKNENFQQPSDAIQAESGSKRSLSSVFASLRKMGYDIESLQFEIDSLIRFTIAGVQPFLANSYHAAVPMYDGKSRCFEILGFDVLLDENLHPWLLEVNCMPSLSCDSPFDERLKFGVIKGALRIMNLSPNFRKLVLKRERAVAQMRIAGTTALPVPVLFDADVESEIAKTTQWRQIFPLEDNAPGSAETEQALRVAKESPVGAAVETAASRARKEAVLAQLKEQKVRPQPPRSARKSQGNEAKPIGKAKPRPFKLPAIPPPSREGKVLDVFQDATPNVVAEEEERERLRSFRQQIIAASMTLMLPAVRRLLEGVPEDENPKKSAQRRISHRS